MHIPRLGRTLWCLFLVVFIFILHASPPVHAERVIRAYRGIQFDREKVSEAAPSAHTSPAQLVELGVRRTSLQLPAVFFDVEDIRRVSSSSLRKNRSDQSSIQDMDDVEVLNAATNPRVAAVVRYSDVTVEFVRAFLAGEVAQGFVVLASEDDIGKVEASSDVVETWSRIEDILYRTRVDFPFYLAIAPSDVYSSLTSGESLFLVVNEKEPSSSLVPPIPVIEGWLRGDLSSDGFGPTIGLVTHYDTMGAFPEFASGIESVGSGILALLDTQRTLSKLYSSPKTRGHHNVLFLLSGAGRLSYAGTKMWLSQVDGNALESLQFALCLEHILGNKLYLHVSRPPQRDEVVRTVVETMEKVAASLGIDFEVIHKKVSTNAEERAFEHEQFSFKRVAAGTLSTIREPGFQALRSSAFSKRRLSSEDLALLKRNVRFVGEVLAALSYSRSIKDTNPNSVFGSLISNSPESFYNVWLNMIGNETLFQAAITKDSDLVSSFKSIFDQYTEASKVVSEPVKVPLRFYGARQVSLSVFTVVSSSFELVVALTILALLFLVSVYVVGFSQTVDNLRHFFGRGSSKKHVD